MTRPFTPVMTGDVTVAIPDHGTGIVSHRLGALFDAHHQRLYRLARRMLRNADDARDLVQETFLRAARAPGTVPVGDSSEEAWLVRVLVNLCKDRWRQAATRQRLDATGGLRPAAGPADPETALVVRSVVWRALESLAPRRRAVVIMHELEGVSVQAIAQMLGVTAVTVRWHLSRGRLQLAAVIREQEDKA